MSSVEGPGIERAGGNLARRLVAMLPPLDVVQKLCGHRDPRSAVVYAKLADQAQVEAIRLPRAAPGRRSPSRR